jgi:hypothetical protein
LIKNVSRQFEHQEDRQVIASLQIEFDDGGWQDSKSSINPSNKLKIYAHKTFFWAEVRAIA